MPIAIVTDRKGVIEHARWFPSSHRERRHPSGIDVELKTGEQLWWLRDVVETPTNVKNLPRAYRLYGTEEEPEFRLIAAEKAASEIRKDGLIVLEVAYRSALSYSRNDASPVQLQIMEAELAEAKDYTRYEDEPRDKPDMNYSHLVAYREAWLTGLSGNTRTLWDIASRIKDFHEQWHAWAVETKKVYIEARCQIFELEDPTTDSVATFVGEVQWPDTEDLRSEMIRLLLPA